MKFEDVYGRWREASLGMSERTFRRCRYEAEGAAGLYDWAGLGAPRAGGNAGAGAVRDALPGLHLVCEHGFGLNNWLRELAGARQDKPAPRRGAHRRKRPRRPVVGMMLHQDGSSHEWVAGQWWDLIVNGRCDRIYSGFFGMSTFRGLKPKTGCSARSTPIGPRTTGTRPRQAAVWRTTRPRSAGPWRSSASS